MSQLILAYKLWIALGAINAFLAVGFGAFGAHGLKAKLTAQMLAVYQTGVEYHMAHALGLVLIGVMSLHFPESVWLKTSAGLLLLGIILFSGSLYILSMTGIRQLGMITPIGGLAFLLGWLCLFVAIVKT